mgnify:FL=1
MKNLIFLFLITIPLITFGQSSHTISASPYNVFSPSDLTINIGDTVFFVNMSTHNAVEVDENTYNNNGTTSNGGFELYTDGYVVLEEVGTYYYVCTPHVMFGMKGKINVEGESQTAYTIDQHVIELSGLATSSDFSSNTYYNPQVDCEISWQIVEKDLPAEWDFSICFPNCYNPGIESGTGSFVANSQQYLGSHFYPNNTAGQGEVKMEITTNSNIIDTVIFVGTATSVSNIGDFLMQNNDNIESIFTLEGKKLEKIEPNTTLFIRFKSGLLQKLFILE